MRSNAVFSRWSCILSLCLAAALAACDTSSSDGLATAVPVEGGSPADPTPGNVVPSGATDPGDGGTCNPDACAATVAGVTWNCKDRFMYGANWAWQSFGVDFGGVAAWGEPGVSGNEAAFSASLRQMKADGVSVVRWWMFPRFLTEAISWANGAPAGIGGTLVADIQRALAIAEQQDVYIMLTLFSFDNFRPTTTENGVYSRGIRPMVVDPTLRRNLLENLVGPVADAVEHSPYRKRMIAWDIVNEPEWAVSGPSVTGDPEFPGGGGLESVTHGEMETFLKEATALLHSRSSALVSVGGAAIKWPKAWSRVGLDFYQFHYYDWVYEWFPYSQVTLASAGVTDKPVVMGEFPADGLSAIPSQGLPARSGSQFAGDLLASGYAGALSWAFNDTLFPWDPGASRSFADQRGCEVRY